ncbi:unnamed protein product, partial [Laminaria digitata]
VALGVCLSEISLGLDTKARETTMGGGDVEGKRWFGHKFRKMEVALLGNFSRYNALDEASEGAGTADEKKQKGLDEASPAPTLAVTKFASVRGLSAYFCRDAECYSRSDRQETLRRLKQGLKTPPLQLPPLLKRCRLGLGVTVALSTAEWGRIDSMDIRLLAGDLHVQLVDDQLGHLLRWASLWNGHMRKLAQSALRPSRALVHPGRPTAAADTTTEDTAKVIAEAGTEEDVTKNTAEEPTNDSSSTEDVIEDNDGVIKDINDTVILDVTGGVVEDNNDGVIEDSAEGCTNNSLEDGVIEDSSAVGGPTNDGVEDVVVEDTTEDLTKNDSTGDTTTTDGTENFIEGSTAVATKDSTENIIEESTKDATKDSTEDITRDLTEDIIKDSTETIVEDSTEDITEGVTAVITKNSSGDIGEDGGRNNGSSRYYRALWKHAGNVVLRDLRSSVRQRGGKTMHRMAPTQAPRGESREGPLNAEESEYRLARGLLWRNWGREWVEAARYLSVRQLLHPMLRVGTFEDNSGGTHRRLHEHLDLGSEEEAMVVDVNAMGSSPESETQGKNLAQYLMPWQLPQEDVLTAWSLVERRTLRWETRQSGGTKVALDEENSDAKQLSPALLQALWSVQLQMEASLPHRICAIVRQMAALKIARRTTMDRLWHARAEKQRRLGLGPADPIPTPSSSLAVTRSISAPVSKSEGRDSFHPGVAFA